MTTHKELRKANKYKKSLLEEILKEDDQKFNIMGILRSGWGVDQIGFIELEVDQVEVHHELYSTPRCDVSGRLLQIKHFS